MQTESPSQVVDNYCDKVISGEVIACRTTIQAVTKYKRERKEAETNPDYPFEFSEQRAMFACAFFPALLCHSIGQWASEPFELSPWQTFFVWNVFGWLKKSNGMRRFKKTFLSVARKNGKSTFCAGLALLLCFADREEGAQIFIGATKLEQARIIWAESDRMLRKSPSIMQHAEILKDNIRCPKTNSFIKPLGSDKPFDGLNPHGMFFDEMHAMKEHHRQFFNTMVTGSGARLQPLEVTITTAGDEKSLIYHEEADYARGVIAGDIEDDSVFGMIFELDEEDDFTSSDFTIETMQKSNPNLGISVSREHLTDKRTEALNKPQAKNRFLRYHANVCVSSVESAMSAEIWDRAKGELSDWSVSDGIAAGFDLGGQDDLASYALTAKFKINEDAQGRAIYRYEGKSVAFMSSETKRDLTAEPWRTWIEKGQLIVSEYVISTLKEHLLEDCENLGIEFIAYDPYQAAHLAEELKSEGLKPVKMAQSHVHFTETIRSYQSEISEGRFRPDENDEILRWCALNMALNENAREQVMPDKAHSKEKIDAVVAWLMSRRAVNLAKTRITGSLVL